MQRQFYLKMTIFFHALVFFSLQLILASQSKYFAAFFANESEATEVSLQFTTGVIQTCMGYIYTRCIAIDHSNVQVSKCKFVVRKYNS
jgi:BTB/POZ domain